MSNRSLILMLAFTFVLSMFNGCEQITDSLPQNEDQYQDDGANGKEYSQSFEDALAAPERSLLMRRQKASRGM